MIGDKSVIKTISNILDESMLHKIESCRRNETFVPYTEHVGRHGIRVDDDELIMFLNDTLKRTIAESLGELDQSDRLDLIQPVMLCRDEAGFELSTHVDDSRKHISCVIYLEDDVQGTVFMIGVGLRKEIRAERNKLLYFKSKDLFHCVPKTDKERHTLQFAYALKSDAKSKISVVGFNQKDLIRFFRSTSPSVLHSELTVDTTLLQMIKDPSILNVVNQFTVILTLGNRHLHIGIDPELKSIENYKTFFFQYNNTFVGVAHNFLYDANLAVDTTGRSLRGRYVMISQGSWNHQHKIYFETKPGILEEFLQKEPDVLGELWSPSYIIGHTNNVVALFVQNYSVREYWFGWSPSKEDDAFFWLRRELGFLQSVLRNTEKQVLVKFHPKMADEYVKMYQQSVNDNRVSYCKAHTPLRTLFDSVDSCVVNSGSTAIMAFLWGKPVFYIDDAYSSIPVNRLGTACLNRIDTIQDDSVLPDRNRTADFIFSQIFSLEELQKRTVDDLFEFGTLHTKTSTV